MIDKEQTGKTTEEETTPKKISLKRKSVSTIKVKRASGKNATVSVVRKKRKVYVKKSPEEAKKLLLEEDKIHGSEDIISSATAEPVVPAESKQENKEESDSVAADVEQKPAAGMAESKSEAVAETTAEESSAASTTQGESSSSKSSDGSNKKDAKPAATKQAKQQKSKDAKDTDSDSRKKKKGKNLKENKSKSSWKQNVKRSMGQDDEEFFFKSKSHKRKKSADDNEHSFQMPVEPKVHDVQIPETITVADLAKRMSIKASEVIKVLINMGTMVTINQYIDQDTAILAVEELGHKPVPHSDNDIEEEIEISYAEEVVDRDPVITVMGHVDHGKTTLLDYIRKANVAAGETGGITQHMAAYRAKTKKGMMTFLDTPGHSAFTAMRARGASCTDIVILVVAADDGVMPQTKEAIQHAQAAGVPIVVALNKMDKPEADPERVTSELGQIGLMPEAWGGDTIFCNISAKAGTGIDELLESVYMLSELLELKAHKDGPAQGVVLESRLERGRGPVSTVLIKQGCLKKGEVVIAGTVFGRVRMMQDENGKSLPEAGPSIPVEVTGLSGPSSAGDIFQVINDEKKAREVVDHRVTKDKEARLIRQRASQLDGAMSRMSQSNSEVKELNLLVKADVQGSVEVLNETLQKLSNDDIKVRVISSGVGGFNESDVNLAMASSAVMIGFNVRADSSARRLAQEEGVTFHYYSVIYDIIDGIKATISGKIGPRYEEKITGLAEVKDVFKSSKIGAIAGCMVIEGSVKRGNPIRVLRQNVVIYEGELESLRRFKDDVNDVKSGTECGIGVKQYNDIKPGDQIEVFEKIEVEYKFD